MKSQYFCTILMLAFSFHEILGKVYSRCELAITLVNKGFPRHEINNWVCLIESESGRNTRAKSRPNGNGSCDYGMFQINSMYWCTGEGTISNDCNMNCNALINDNIDDDCACAKKIYQRHGFSAWYGWKSKCRGRNLDGYTQGCSF